MSRRFWLALGAAWFCAFVAIGFLAHRVAQLERRVRAVERIRRQLADSAWSLRSEADMLDAELRRLDWEDWSEVMPSLRESAQELIDGVQQLSLEADTEEP